MNKIIYENKKKFIAERQEWLDIRNIHMTDLRTLGFISLVSDKCYILCRFNHGSKCQIYLMERPFNFQCTFLIEMKKDWRIGDHLGYYHTNL